MGTMIMSTTIMVRTTMAFITTITIMVTTTTTTTTMRIHMPIPTAPPYPWSRTSWPGITGWRNGIAAGWRDATSSLSIW